MNFLLSTSHSSMLASLIAMARILPSGLNENAAPILPGANVPIAFPVNTSHSLTLPLLTDTSFFPSGLKATNRTPSCRSNVITFLPVATLHSRILPSRLPEASVLLSVLNDTYDTLSVCPLSVADFLPVDMSHNEMVFPRARWRRSKEANVAPSGLSAAAKASSLVWIKALLLLLSPTVAFQSLMLLSQFPDARTFPSGLNATDVTVFLYASLMTNPIQS